MWLAVYKQATGELVSLGTVAADPLPAGMASKDVGESRPSGAWNAATLAFEPVSMPKTWTGYEFLKRLMLAERTAARELAKTDAIAQDFMHLLDRSGEVRQDNQDVLAGLNYLASKGVLAQGRPQEILNG
jgi:hypothetical protein